MPKWKPGTPLHFVEPQLCNLVEKAPSGPQWVHEIKFDGYRMAARIDRGKVQLLTRSGLDWTEKYPETAKALAALPLKTAYLDGELCGVRDDGVTSFELISKHPIAGPTRLFTSPSIFLRSMARTSRNFRSSNGKPVWQSFSKSRRQALHTASTRAATARSSARPLVATG
jgi:ATP dependent DNA ligase domain